MGGPNYEDGRGVVRVYRRVANQVFWEQLGEAIVGDPGDFLGTTLSGRENLVVAGTANGSFKIYEYAWNEWIETKVETVSPVVSVAMRSPGEISVGLESEEVLVYGLF